MFLPLDSFDRYWRNKMSNCFHGPCRCCTCQGVHCLVGHFGHNHEVDNMYRDAGWRLDLLTKNTPYEIEETDNGGTGKDN